MQKLAFILLFIPAMMLYSPNKITHHPEPAPDFIKGNFIDDYGIRYTINDSLWVQQPRSKFHIIKWNAQEQYLIARNDEMNPGEGGMYTRIDYMQFANMAPYTWGFCLTAYDAKTDALAEATAAADRKNPRKGCNGFPFSRMKPAK
ncbi:hypothetical protein FFF34_012110 [Inquilinus sp. KBS0705]|nr:hypothetical protein FFF34_012110 [Inquilinus sp. KBS0705]